MNCDKCKKDFDRPLELYNGEWACPLCHEKLALASADLTVTDENDELFKLAEICYLRALKSQGDKKEYDKLISDCMEFCRSAALSGHPKAMMRLGYLYDAGYFPIDGTEAFKKAYEYYKAVWSASIADRRKGGVAPEYADGGQKLKKNAARLYLNLLKNAPKKLAVHSRYRYESEVAAVKAAGLFDGSDGFGTAPESAGRVQRIIEIFQSCSSRERAPLFGLLPVTGEEFKELCAVRERGKTKLLAFAEKAGAVMFEARSGNYRAVKTERDISEIGEGEYYLYFFNTGGRHRLPSGSVYAVKRAMEKSGTAGEFGLVNGFISAISAGERSNDYVFFDDDVIVHKSRAESFKHALGDLMKTVKENTEKGE